MTPRSNKRRASFFWQCILLSFACAGTSSEYVISLKAFNERGEGLPIYETTFTREETTPEPVTPLMPPIGVKAAVLSATRARLTWTDTTLRGQRVHDSRYYVVRYNPKLARKQRFVNSTQLTVELFDLRPYTDYEFSVKVIRGQRRSTWSLSVFNSTLEAAPSTAPRDLAVHSVDGRPSWATVSWQAPRQINGKITGYLLFFTTDATQPDSEWVVEGVVGVGTSTTVHGLSPLTTYYFKVQARNSVGVGPLCPTVIFRTPASDGRDQRLKDDAYPRYDNTGAKNDSSVPAYVVWILTSCVGGIMLVAAIVVVVVLCVRRRRPDKRTDSDLPVGDGPKPGAKDLKPPDLWIHDRVGQRRTSHASNSAVSSAGGAPSVAGSGSQDVNDDTLSIETSHEDERYRRPVIRPFMIPIDHPPPPRDPLVLGRPNGHLLSPELGSSFGGGGGGAGSSGGSGTVIRTGLYPRATPSSALHYAHSTPRVNAGDLTQPSIQADYALSTLERHRTKRDGQKQLGSSSRLAGRQTAPHSSAGGYARHQPSTSSSPASAATVASPPPQLSSSAAMFSTASSGKTRSPLPTLLSRSPDVTVQSSDGQTQQQDLPKSASTEELTAEMANLEGLMKDLNAITQHEFQC